MGLGLEQVSEDFDGGFVVVLMFLMFLLLFLLLVLNGFVDGLEQVSADPYLLTGDLLCMLTGLLFVDGLEQVSAP